MLVLSDANRLRIDLHELSERILQAPSDRYRAAHGEVEVRELLARDFGSGVDGRAGLAYGDHDRSRYLGMLLAQLLQRLAHEGLRLASSGAVPDGDRLGTVLRDDERDRLRGLERILLGEDDGLAEVLARRVHHRDLAAGADSGVDGEHGLLPERRGEEKVPQVLREHLDGRAVRLVLLVHRDVHFAGRREQAPVGVARGELDLLAVLSDHVEDAVHHRVLVDDELHPEDALLLPAADGEIAVRGDGRDRLLEVVVLLELRRLLRRRARDLALDARVARELVADHSAHVGVVGDALGDDVARELKVFVRRLRAVPQEPRALPHRVRERLVALLLRDLRARAALWLVRLVYVLEAGLDEARRDRGAQLVRELALLLDGL